MTRTEILKKFKKRDPAKLSPTISLTNQLNTIQPLDEVTVYILFLLNEENPKCLQSVAVEIDK